MEVVVMGLRARDLVANVGKGKQQLVTAFERVGAKAWASGYGMIGR
jgi:hypothetical protein